MISPLQGISPSSVIIQSGATGDKNLEFLPPFIKESLYDLPPSRVFMDFIKNEEACTRWESLADHVFSILGVIPRKISLFDVKTRLFAKMFG
jgi:hypothetical protein